VWPALSRLPEPQGVTDADAEADDDDANDDNGGDDDHSILMLSSELPPDTIIG
jgi:hypothetical protein